VRDQRLDILRALAVICVLGRHVEYFPLWHQAGWIGVDLFFVISGFLISGLLFNDYKAHGAIGLKNFYIRRGLKIYPAFYLLLGFTLIVIWVGHLPFGRRQILAEALFLQNYVGGFWPHTWSLAVEEHFYIALPLLLTWMIRRGKGERNPFRALPAVFCTVALAALLMRAITRETTYNHYIFPSHLRIDALLFGVTLSYLFHFRKDVFGRVSNWRWLPLASGLAILPSVLYPQERYFIHTVGFTLLYLGFGGLLLTVLRRPWTPRGRLASLAMAQLAAMGSFSYSIYLWHAVIADWGRKAMRSLAAFDPRVLAWYDAANFYIYVAVSIAVGILMAKLVEMPTLAWRDRLFPSRSAAVEEEQAASRAGS
jgi:peptidoglycan/LPS O-acetylase OafA/YrhL